MNVHYQFQRRIQHPVKHQDGALWEDSQQISAANFS